MSFPHSAAAVDEQRIESRRTRLLGYRDTGGTGQFVRLTCHERVKRIERVELRVKIGDLTWVARHQLTIVRMLQAVGRRQIGGSTGSGVNQHTVLETCALTKNAIDSRREQRDIILLDILRHKLRFDLQHKDTIRKLQRNNGCEPSLVSTARQIVSQNGLTLRPFLFDCLRHIIYIRCQKNNG